jgi:hypothetical protein
MAWPRFSSIRVEPQGANQMAAPAEPRTPNLHRANESLLESANGSMATAATRRGFSAREKNFVSEKRKKLTMT